MLSTFSRICRPFVCVLQKNVCLGPSPIIWSAFSGCVLPRSRVNCVCVRDVSAPLRPRPVPLPRSPVVCCVDFRVRCLCSWRQIQKVIAKTSVQELTVRVSKDFCGLGSHLRIWSPFRVDVCAWREVGFQSPPSACAVFPHCVFLAPLSKTNRPRTPKFGSGHATPVCFLMAVTTLF